MKHEDEKEILRKYLSKIGRKGGKTRAKKYDKATLSEWSKRGGRPKAGHPKGEQS